MKKESPLDKYAEDIFILYKKGLGCPEIVVKLKLPITARSVQRYLRKLNLLRKRKEALALSENRRQATIQARWEGYIPQYKRKAISSAKRFRIMTRDGFKCKVCGNTPENGAILETDHIIAVTDGGSNDDSNMQTICNLCNQGKYWTNK